MNKRGEVITVGVITVAVIVGLLGFMAGSSGLSRLNPFAAKQNKTKQVTVSKSESKPVFVTGQDGKQYVLQATSVTNSTSESSEEQKLTLWQKLMVLPKLWLLLMVLGIFFPPIAGIMGLINRKLWGETKRIVGGVEESLKTMESTPEIKKKVLDTLSMKFDSSTKKLVSDIKRTI